jgi:hypothetical protein
MLELDLDRNPCVCGHSSGWHYGDEDEATESGIVLRRARCHSTAVEASAGHYPRFTLTPCGCRSFKAKPEVGGAAQEDQPDV